MIARAAGAAAGTLAIGYNAGRVLARLRQGTFDVTVGTAQVPCPPFTTMVVMGVNAEYTEARPWPRSRAVGWVLGSLLTPPWRPLPPDGLLARLPQSPRQ